MAGYKNIKAVIDNNIKENNLGAITGPILNTVLNLLVSTIGTGRVFAGMADPSTDPDNPDADVFYIATKPGIYTNFSKIEVPAHSVCLLYNTASSWGLYEIGTTFVIGTVDSLSIDSSQQDIEAALGCTCDELAAAILAGRSILVADGSSYSPVVVAGATAESITMRLKEPTLNGLLGVEVYCILGKSGGVWAFTTFNATQMLSSENIADNLTTGQYDGNYVLSAYQGKVLKGMVDSLDASLNDITDILTKINNETL